MMLKSKVMLTQVYYQMTQASPCHRCDSPPSKVILEEYQTPTSDTISIISIIPPCIATIMEVYFDVLLKTSRMQFIKYLVCRSISNACIYIHNFSI